MIIVDTHAHINSEDEVRYPKTDYYQPLRPPAGKGTIEHLREEVKMNQVTRVVVVQTGSTYRFDNRLTVDTANENRDWTTGVCTLDQETPESSDLLRHYVKTSNIRGIRFGPTHGRTPPFGHDGHQRLWETAAQLGIVICVLIGTDSTDELVALLERFPETPVVLDHCMGLRAGGNETLKIVCDLASFPNLYAKLTFAATGSDEPYPCRDTHDLVHQVIEAYSPERCTWGSDFPCELWCPKVTYEQQLRIFTEEIQFEPSVRQAILGGAAMRIWFP
ncbi:MAG: amidohydrolase [Candidatus Latescibacteria bacterium]|nr:amidohydrolase [Candidatus Latescibacterota bacterium]